MIWTVGSVTVSDAVPWAYSSTIQRWVPLPGTSVVEAREGRGVTTFGPDGIQGLPDHYASKRLLAIMGDSYIEAFQVDMHQKVFHQFNQIWKGRENVWAVNLGRSDQNLSDAYYLLPRYEKAYPQIAAAVLLVHPNDVLPNNTNQRLTDSLDTPAAFSETLFVPRYPWLGPLLLKYKLSIFYWPFKEFSVSLPSTRFRPGPVGNKTSPEPGFSPLTNPPPTYLERLETFWTSAIRQTRRQTNVPLLIVMATRGPSISPKGVVLERPTEKIETLFEIVCKAQGVPVIPLYDRFVRHVQAGGALPRGFANSRPGQGHFNAVGHRLLAETIAEYLDAHPEFLRERPSQEDAP